VLSPFQTYGKGKTWESDPSAGRVRSQGPGCDEMGNDKSSPPCASDIDRRGRKSNRSKKTGGTETRGVS